MKKANITAPRLSRSVQRRILARFARGERRVVVVGRNGEPSSVWGYEEYKQHEEMPKKVKPWEKRGADVSPPDPLGAVDAAPPQPLTRASMYDMDED